MNRKRKIFYIFCLSLIICSLPGCDSGPIKRVLEKDMKVSVLYKDTKDLAIDSIVYLEDNNKQKVVIGSVKKIETTEEGNKLVNLVINHDYRDMIFTNTMFVLYRSLSANENASILVAAIPGEVPSSPLKSGAIVKGMTLMSYKIMLAKKGAFEAFDAASRQVEGYIDEFKRYVDSLDTDKLTSQIKETAQAIEKYTREQKEKFEREILPEIEKLMEEAKRKLDQRGDLERKKELEEEYEKLKNIVC